MEAFKKIKVLEEDCDAGECQSADLEISPVSEVVGEHWASHIAPRSVLKEPLVLNTGIPIENLFEIDEARLARLSNEQSTDFKEEDLGFQSESGLKNPVNATLRRNQQANAVRAGFEETVFTASGRRTNWWADGPVQLTSSINERVVARWLDPKTVQALSLPSEELISDSARSGQLEAYGNAFVSLIEQAQIFNVRILCSPAESETPVLREYLALLGIVFQSDYLQPHLRCGVHRIATKIQKLGKKLKRAPHDKYVATELGRLYMHNGSVDEVFGKVHARWKASAYLKAGLRENAVVCAIQSGLGRQLLTDVMHSDNAVRFLRCFGSEASVNRMIEASLVTNGGLHILERYIKGNDVIRILKKEMHGGRGQYYWQQLISEGKGLKFLAELADAGGGEAILDSALQSADAVMLLGDALESSAGFKWIDDEIRRFMHSILELRDAIVDLQEHYWQNRERSCALFSAVLKNLRCTDVNIDLDDLNEVLAADSFSLQTFQAIYEHLMTRGYRKLAAAFLNTNAARYFVAPEIAAALGMSLLQRGETVTAISAFENALKEDKGNYEYLRNMAVAALHVKNYKEAERWCGRMLRTKPYNVDAYNLLGISFKNQREYKRSIKYYLKGIKVDPGSVKLHHNLAIAYAQIGKIEHSQKMIKKARLIDNNFRTVARGRARFSKNG